MFDRNFDPFDALIQLNARLKEVEKKHNLLARDYEKTQQDLNVALDAIQNLQQAYVKMAETITLNSLLK